MSEWAWVIAVLATVGALQAVAVWFGRWVWVFIDRADKRERQTITLVRHRETGLIVAALVIDARLTPERAALIKVKVAEMLAGPPPSVIVIDGNLWKVRVKG